MKLYFKALEFCVSWFGLVIQTSALYIKPILSSNIIDTCTTDIFIVFPDHASWFITMFHVSSLLVVSLSKEQLWTCLWFVQKFSYYLSVFNPDEMSITNHNRLLNAQCLYWFGSLALPPERFPRETEVIRLAKLWLDWFNHHFYLSYYSCSKLVVQLSNMMSHP